MVCVQTDIYCRPQWCNGLMQIWHRGSVHQATYCSTEHLTLKYTHTTFARWNTVDWVMKLNRQKCITGINPVLNWISMMLLYNYIIQKVKQVSCAVLLVRWLLGLLHKETECSEKTHVQGKRWGIASKWSVKLLGPVMILQLHLLLRRTVKY